MEKIALVGASPYQIDTIKDVVYKFISDGNDVGIGAYDTTQKAIDNGATAFFLFVPKCKLEDCDAAYNCGLPSTIVVVGSFAQMKRIDKVQFIRHGAALFLELPCMRETLENLLKEICS